ncbi:acyl-CoA-binding protein [Piedraia hortae CBS 480.64]|uniref:Acyl-CoA-binding protein n=1 Tax=Piedraia hortae CBS 480.64 TaxID=1314780 RepID=A0A6A7CAP9_9PEZI|nr:acyl-CoA-binding protein [Piedraia hortae CBS 480.64]
MTMPVPQSEEFTKAVEESRKLAKKPTNDELLKLYGLYKQGTQDPPFKEAKAPGMFAITEKAKYSAWEAVSSKTPEAAQEEYVALVEKLKGEYGLASE